MDFDADVDTEKVIEVTNGIGIISGVIFSLIFGISGFFMDASLFEGSVLFFFGLLGGYAAVWILLIGLVAVLVIASIIVGKVLGYLILIAIASGIYLIYFIISLFSGGL